MRFRNLVPNLPDVVMRRIFDFLSYQQLCKAECVCRRWQSIVLSIMRRNVHEITIDRFGSSKPSVHQVAPFHRLSVSCAPDAFDFLAGVIRRSRLSLIRMTADIEFLTNLKYVYVNKDERRKYFSNVDELWLLIVDCNDAVTEGFLQIEEKLFSEINFLTLQVHLTSGCYQNVAKVVNAFTTRHPKATLRLEFHAEKSSMIFAQLLELPAISLRRLKLICTEFDLPVFRFAELYRVMKERNIKTKSIVARDWTLIFDRCTPITAYPIDALRISSCTVESADSLIEALRLTAQQQLPKVKRVARPTDGVLKPKVTNENTERPKVKKTVRKRAFIKKLELAGQCTLRGLQFLQHKAHEELEKRLKIAVPDIVVNCEDIYYCW
ncbi:F-box domain-containing protein [Trichostrongylus colubriformis]|uniref:F-box domain-containing protein n=1 Tax=Trichostrongylus colubriformis TaxID=6319 RepID=A0AAN8IQ92_TRICO